MVSKWLGRRNAGGVACRNRSRLPHRRTVASNAPERLEGRTLLAADFVISEFMASNDNTLVDRFGVNSDWIEIHNRGNTAGSLEGYYLTDNSTDLGQWRFPAVSVPAGGYVLVLASGRNLATGGEELHTNFRLDSGGEYLALVRPDGFTVQHAYAPSYPNQTDDVSYGLTNAADPASAHQFFTQPTPGRTNVANAPEPVFSVESKTFTGSFALTLSLPPGAPAGAEIRYTTNRSLPTAASTLYTGPINISNSTVVRALVTAPGRTPSPVVSRTYVALDASVQSFNSNLPVVVVDTFGGGLNDVTLTPVSAYFIDTDASDGRAEMLDAPDFAGRGGLRLRGQSSQGFPKSPYAFETWDENDGDKSVSILGMPRESDWILYNPYSEKSLMQNQLAYLWSNRIGQYAVRTRYVELFVNASATGTAAKVDYAGDYRGVYIFMERIKIDGDRVDIEKLTPEDNTAPNVTGGYIWKKDKWDGNESGFSAGGQTYQYFEPSEEEITAEQAAYLSDYINDFNAALTGPNFKDPVNGYARYIDVDSWIDHHIMVEMTKNIDGFRLSTYYHKDRNGKITMGPIWDYNLSLGNADYLGGQNPTGWYRDALNDGEYPYWRRLFQDPAFAQKYQDRWQELRKDELSTERLMGDIDDAVRLLSDGNGNYPTGNNPQQPSNNPVVRNFKKWRVLGTYVWPNGYYDPQGRWIEDVNWMKNWLRQRVEWWDRQYLAMPAISPAGGAVTAPTQVTITSSGGTGFVDTPLLTAGAPARALVPSGDIGTGWRDRGFDDSSWQSGTTGVGYDFDTGYRALIGLDVEMRNVNPTVYVRVPFNVTSPGSVQQLFLRMKYDDAFVAYLNGTEIARSGNAPSTLGWNAGATNTRDEAQAVQFVDFDVSQFKNRLVQGSNVLALHGLNSGAGSSDLLILPELVSRSSTTAPAPVWYTTDGTDPRRPDGTRNPAALQYSGPFTVTGTTRVLARSFLNNKWSGLASELYDFGENRLRITELMYHPSPPLPTSPYLPGDFEYVELQNFGTAAMNLAGVRFDRGIDFTFPNRTLAPDERVLVVRNLAAFQSRYGTGLPVAGTYTGALSDAGERIVLLGRVGEAIHDFTYSDDWYDQTDGEGYSLTIVDPAAALTAWGTKDGWRASEPFNGTPGAGDAGVRPNSVVINEIMTNAPGGGDGDWIELLNTTGAGIDIGGWWLSDSKSGLQKWQIPAGTTIAANGLIVFNQDGHFGNAFSFASGGEGVYLSSGNTASGEIGGYRVDETFGAADSGVTFGRFVKSAGGADFTALVSATRGAANAAPLIGPVVINEIMYSPVAGNSEYVELRNLTAADVPLYLAGSPATTWRLSGGVDFALPGGATIPASGYAIISAVAPATFRQQYPNVPASVPVWGPYTLPSGVNVLSDNGENIRLQRPQVTTATPRPFVDVDRVGYDDESPWPADTKGTGQSLGRRVSGDYGNDPANWDAERSGGTPGVSNFAADFVAPTADIVNVTPDPRAAAVETITISFSERVTGFDLADLRLTRGGAAVEFSPTVALATSDNGTTWTLRNLGPLTLATGDYVLSITAAGSGIRDTAGNEMTADASDAWRMNNPDAGVPTVNIVDINPDPRKTPVNTVSIVFSEPVTGFDLSDLTLTRDGGPNMLSQFHTLATSDNRTYSLSGLANQTGPEGTYVLAFKSSGTGIADLAGNALISGAIDQWLVDFTAPTVDIVDVTPDLRKDAIDTVTITFSEPVTGVDLADLQLRLEGGANRLTGAQTLTTADNGRTWTLGNLAGLTGAEGRYDLALVSDASGIVDAGNNPLGAGAAASWTVDLVRPTVDVEDVSPDPRADGVESMLILFSEPVVGFTLADLQLVRQNADGSATNVLTAEQTLGSPDGGVLWVLGNLRGVTTAPGTYTLTLVSGVAAITDLAGNSLGADGSDAWQVSAPGSVQGRHVFYNRSGFDGGLAAANSADDGAIAADKQALLPGNTATFANYTGFYLGLNGLMIDVAGLPAGAGGASLLSAADFVFKVGNTADPSGWAAGRAPTGISVRRGAGVGGSDRVTLAFPDGAIKNQWLQVTMKANANTGLGANDVFYFGNLCGETGDSKTGARVNAIDLVGTRNNLFKRGLPITNRFDHNRDGRLDSRDLALVRANLNKRLELLRAPTGVGVAAVAPASAALFADSVIAPNVIAPSTGGSGVARVWSESQDEVLS